MNHLKKLSELPGAPGREESVRAFIRDRVEDHCDEIEADSLGNLICRKKPADTAPEEETQTVMVGCHMDEIAFYVRHIDDDGFIRLQHLGGFDVRNLFARRVQIQTRDGDKIPGNLNPVGKPVHLSSKEDRNKVPEINELFVDTGLPAEEVKERVTPGDPVTLTQNCIDMGELISGKALDNRVACWVGVRLLERLDAPSCDLHVVFTTQEEIGIRGATTSGFSVDPDIGIGIDITLACDIPDVSEEDEVVKLGDGAAIKILDSSMVSDKELVDEFIELAESHDITHQYEVLPAGGTDGGAIQRARSGARALTLSVPCRYVHTVTETIHPDDLRATVDLLHRYVID